MTSPLAAISHWWSTPPQGVNSLLFMVHVHACQVGTVVPAPCLSCDKGTAVGGKGQSAWGVSEVGTVSLYP